MIFELFLLVGPVSSGLSDFTVNCSDPWGSIFIYDVLYFVKMVNLAIISSGTDHISYMASLGGHINSKG